MLPAARRHSATPSTAFSRPTDVLVQACLNGGRSRDEHPAIPQTPSELAAEARAAVDAGAEIVHIHPRDDSGGETLEAGPEARALIAVREACPRVPVSVAGGPLVPRGGSPRPG